MPKNSGTQSIAGLSKFIESGTFHYAAQLIRSTDASAHRGRWFEWLVRPELEANIDTGEFIQAVESLELGLDLDQRSSRDALKWLGRQPIDTRLCINISACSFSNRLFPHHLESLIEQNSILPEQICFDLAVNSAVSDLSGATRFVKYMRKIGCKLALDNGLPGHPVLGLFASLGLIDYMKIDRNWIAAAPTSPSHRQTLESIVEYSKRLGLQMVAEGVDSNDQLELVRQLGVQYYQGFIDGKPQLIVDSDEKGSRIIEMIQSA